MNAELTLRYEFTNDPSDDFGWLSVRIDSGSFAGSGGFWVQWQEVVEFGASLSVYPIPIDPPLRVQWGFDKLEGDDLRLSIEIGPENSTGDLRVKAEVANYSNPDERVRTSFLTHYAELAAFSTSVGKLMSRDAEEATLLGG